MRRVITETDSGLYKCPLDKTPCLGPQCMMWSQAFEDGGFDEFARPKPMIKIALQGYCGL